MKYVRGYTWGFGTKRGIWRPNTVKESLQLLIERTAIDTVAIPTMALQDTAHSVHIDYKGPHFPTNEEIEIAITTAMNLGLRVILKPMVNVKDGTWRAFINFFDYDVPCEPKWSEWFISYTEYILAMAQLAEKHKVEMFCVGCELVMTDRREREWRELIKQVRNVYSGLITYNCDKYQESHVTWWDAVDVISSSGYYPINAWDQELNRIEEVLNKYQKPFFFMEAGCPSSTGLSLVPNDWTKINEVNLEEQRAYFEEMFVKTNERNWFSGFCFWDWPTIPYHLMKAELDSGYLIYGKPAEQVVKKFYLSRGTQ